MSPLEIVLIIALAALLIIGAIVVVAILTKNRRRRNGQAKPSYNQNAANASAWESRTITADKMQITDFVDIGGQTYEVKAHLAFTEGKYTWSEFWLDSPGSKVWLSVERVHDKLEVIQWTELPMIEDFKPGSKKLAYNGLEYMLDDDGEADYRSTGPTDLPDTGTAEYFDYKAADGQMLSFERFDGDEWEMAEGWDLGSDWISIHPGVSRTGSK